MGIGVLKLKTTQRNVQIALETDGKTMTVKISNKFISANGKRAGIRIDCGPWNEFAKHPEMIKVRCKKGIFPTEIRDEITVTNDSDSREDYFEADALVLIPGDELYEAAKAVA